MSVISEVYTQAFSNSAYDLDQQAARFYRKAQHSAWLNRLAAWLRRERAALADLQVIRCSGRVRASHYTGLRSVPIVAVRGSEARSTDFDREFHPTSCRSYSRWTSIFKARLAGKPLPPVVLIKVGGEYYVRDGHHRISVASALGEQFIEAEVTVWETAP